MAARTLTLHPALKKVRKDVRIKSGTIIFNNEERHVLCSLN